MVWPGEGFPSVLFDLAGYDKAACTVGSAFLLPGVAVGATGDIVGLRSFFDGWGYVHLYRNDASGKLTELDTWAIPEAMNPANATGKGDLSVHEVATSSVDSNLAYFSYYSGGFRVAKINSSNKIEQVGHFIDEGGNNFWGVQTFMHNGEEYVAASDRDFGLSSSSTTAAPDHAWRASDQTVASALGGMPGRKASLRSPNFSRGLCGKPHARLEGEWGNRPAAALRP